MKERGRPGQRKVIRDKKSALSSGPLIFYFTVAVHAIRGAGKHCYQASGRLIPSSTLIKSTRRFKYTFTSLQFIVTEYFENRLEQEVLLASMTTN